MSVLKYRFEHPYKHYAPVKVIAIDKAIGVKVGNSAWCKWVSMKWYLDKLGLPEVGDEINLDVLKNKQSTTQTP